MKSPKTKNSIQEFKKALKKTPKEKYVLRLYVTGMTYLSKRAIENLSEICKEHLAGRYELEVIDITKESSLAAGDQIIAAPTLVKKLPLPLRRFIGDLSDKEKIVLGLDLKKKK